MARMKKELYSSGSSGDISEFGVREQLRESWEPANIQQLYFTK